MLDNITRPVKDRLLNPVVSFTGDLLVPALYVLNKRMKISGLMAPIYPYPTRGEAYCRIAGIHLSPKLFNDRVRKLLRVLYGFRG